MHRCSSELKVNTVDVPVPWLLIYGPVSLWRFGARWICGIDLFQRARNGHVVSLGEASLPSFVFIKSRILMMRPIMGQPSCLAACCRARGSGRGARKQHSPSDAPTSQLALSAQRDQASETHRPPKIQISDPTCVQPCSNTVGNQRAPVGKRSDDVLWKLRKTSRFV